MSELRWVTLERAATGVRILTVDRPPVNALGRELVDELGKALAQLREDADGRCLVLRSGGRHFSAGADLKERQGMSVDEVREFVQRLSAVFTELAELAIPSIAAVRGAAVGGGCELALACDLRILSEDVSIGLRETALAILPGAGGTQRLPRLIGPARAKRWIFAAQAHGAEQALADGVADRVVPAGELDRAATRLAEIIASHGPVAVRLAKKAVDSGLDVSLAQGLGIEWECYQKTLGTQDRAEALAAFAAKRPARFRGR